MRFRFLFHVAPVAGANENAFLHAGVPAALQVNQFVPDKKALCEVEVEFIARIEKKLWGWLASAAGLIRRFGRKINLLEAHAIAREFGAQMGVNVFYVRNGEITAAHAGLIGNDEKFKA